MSRSVNGEVINFILRFEMLETSTQRFSNNDKEIIR